METKVVKSSARKARGEERTLLDRNNWIETAMDVLATEGIGGLRVETLAKTCGVTKGSFYWHFKDRQDLLLAVLTYWRDGRIRDIEKQTTAPAGKELEQLYHVIEVYGSTRNRKGVAIEIAVRDWARRDPEAAAVIESVDIYRLDCTRKLFRACGLSEDEARSRSLLLYAYVFGQSLMFYQHFSDNLTELKRMIAERIVAA
ncbi:MAG: hypothetical protein RIR00_411 [Pseudomonadota bacterium]|jgi:AcrR family transcriptional regulator